MFTLDPINLTIVQPIIWKSSFIFMVARYSNGTVPDVSTVLSKNSSDNQENDNPSPVATLMPVCINAFYISFEGPDVIRGRVYMGWETVPQLHLNLLNILFKY